MTLVRSGLIAIFSIMAGLGFAASKAQAQTFTFEVCNSSSVSASVAVSNLASVGSSQFTVQGWWTVTPGSCSTLGTFPQGWFYYYAEQTNSGAYAWAGDFALCVDYPGPFSRINTSNFKCSSDRLKLFGSKLVGSETGTLTWVLH